MGEDLPNWIIPILNWMESTWINDFALGPQWTWPIMETLHFTGMCLLFGPLLIMDLRVLGFDRLTLPQGAVHKLIPLTILGFVINLLTGIVFVTFFSSCPRCFKKFGAGVAVFHRLKQRLLCGIL